MSNKTRQILLAIAFGIVQVVLLCLFVCAFYYIGQTELALEIMKYKSPPDTIMFISAGFVTVFFISLVIFVFVCIVYLLYAWGNFTLRQASKVDTKVRHKLYLIRNAKRSREQTSPHWEV